MYEHWRTKYYQSDRTEVLDQATRCKTAHDLEETQLELEATKTKLNESIGSVDELTSSVQYLEELLQDNRTITTKEGRNDTPAFRKCVMGLLNCNVAVSQVLTVIQSSTAGWHAGR